MWLYFGCVGREDFDWKCGNCWYKGIYCLWFSVDEDSFYFKDFGSGGLLKLDCGVVSLIFGGEEVDWDQEWEEQWVEYKEFRKQQMDKKKEKKKEKEQFFIFLDQRKGYKERSELEKEMIGKEKEKIKNLM